MITKNELRYYSSLLKKKYRLREKKFLAEGIKIVEEGVKSNYTCERIFITSESFTAKEKYFKTGQFKNIPVEIIKKSEFQRLTDTVTPQGIVGVFNIPQFDISQEIKTAPVVYLENISDPGNLGTIIRTCDWFGIETVLLSENCVDVYNPKVIRSSMGSIFHPDIFDEVSIDKLTVLKEKGYKLLCSDIHGENIYDFEFPAKAVISFSNEAAGPSELLLKEADYRITIPKSGKAESLNVGAAAAVILAEVKNRK